MFYLLEVVVLESIICLSVGLVGLSRLEAIINSSSNLKMDPQI